MDAETHQFLVSDDDAGQRIDRFLADQLAGHSRSRIADWIRDGRVTVGEAKIRPSTKVLPGQTVIVRPPPPPPSEIVPQDLSLDILFSDDDLIVVEKPAGLVVHPGAGPPALKGVNRGSTCLGHRFHDPKLFGAYLP